MDWRKVLLDSPVVGGVIKKNVSAKADHDAHIIAEHFAKYFQAESASTETLRDEVFKIRHSIYCEELAFEEKRLDRKEQDEFDIRSVFSMIKHKPSGVYTGCVRLVKSSSNDEWLPIEKYCAHAIQNRELHPENFARNDIFEISRLAVKSDFRRRKIDKFDGSATGGISEYSYSEVELRCFPFITIGLYMAAATLAVESGVEHCYVMMEPRLARSMRFVGIKFIQIGEPVDYHGMRAPYYISTTMFLENLSPGFKTLYLGIKHDILRQLESVF